MTVTIYINVTHNGEVQPTRQIVVTDTALNAVLFDFNPSANDDVTVIKALCGALIEKMRAIQAAPNQISAKSRCASIAITDIEKVQMMAVKALFAK